LQREDNHGKARTSGRAAACESDVKTAGFLLAISPNKNTPPHTKNKTNLIKQNRTQTAPKLDCISPQAEFSKDGGLNGGEGENTKRQFDRSKNFVQSQTRKPLKQGARKTCLGRERKRTSEARATDRSHFGKKTEV